MPTPDALFGATAFWTEAGRFLTDLLDSITSGILFFGGPLDIILAVADILATAFVVYLVLRLMRDSRAWQLVKGIGLILVFAWLSALVGLSTVGFLLGNTLSVLAIAFVVLFQPELRRALETVGRSSLKFLAGGLVEESPQSSHSIHNTIESIVRACDRMAQDRTGALIVIERETRMGELAEQENAVILDSAVSSAALLQIFYKGSPLHDGAVLVRNGRIHAARCHIPLSDNLHIRRDYGTRHRAAVGASEMGDAIAVVVSEERGTISVGFEGRLYAMESPDTLRILLHKLLGSKQPGVFTSLLRGRGTAQESEAERTHAAAMTGEVAEAVEADRRTHEAKAGAKKGMRVRLPRGRQLLMMVSSVAIACMLWFYVQVTTNPVETRIYTVKVQTVHAAELESRSLTVSSLTDSVAVSVMGRRKSLEGLPAEAIAAEADVGALTKAGIFSLPVAVTLDAKGYFRVSDVTPASATVRIAATS